MAVSKTARTIIAAATSNSAGSTTTGTVVDLTGKLGGFLTMKLTNGATAPTVAPNLYVYTSHDNSNFKQATKLAGDTVNNSVTEYSWPVHWAVMYLRVDVKDNTVQAVTCEAFLQELTSAA